MIIGNKWLNFYINTSKHKPIAKIIWFYKVFLHI